MTETQNKKTGATCPDCVAEGNSTVLPRSDFYEYKADRYAGNKRRSPYCITHTNKRTTARLQAKLDPASPVYDPDLHARRKIAKTKYMHKKLDPASSEYDKALAARQRAARQASKAARRGDAGRRVRSSALEQPADSTGHWTLMQQAADRIGVSIGTIRNMQLRGTLARPLTAAIVATLSPADKPARAHLAKGELTIAAAAQLLGVSEDTVYKYKRRGLLSNPLTRASVEALKAARAAQSAQAD